MTYFGDDEMDRYMEAEFLAHEDHMRNVDKWDRLEPDWERLSVDREDADYVSEQDVADARVPALRLVDGGVIFMPDSEDPDGDALFWPLDR